MSLAQLTPLETPDGSIFVFTVAQACSNGDLYADGVRKAAPTWHLATPTQFVCHTAGTVWTPTTTLGRIFCEDHGLTVTTDILVWASATLPTGLDDGRAYRAQVIDEDTLALYDLTTGALVAFVNDGAGTYYFGEAAPPAESTVLILIGVLSADSGTAQMIIEGLWTVAAFVAQYAPGLNEASAASVLEQATAYVQAYITEAAWTLCVSQQPPYYEVKRVIAEVASWYLARLPSQQTISAETVTYADDVLKVDRKFAASTQSYVTGALEQIVGQLAAYRRVTTTIDEETEESIYPVGVWWGTGRMF